jgi:hypothetical protein
MKFKYMLRGLGIGMVVAAALMGGYTRKEIANAKANVTAITLSGNYTEETSESESDTEELSDTDETVPVIVRDSNAESEIASVIESAKAAESEPSALENVEMDNPNYPDNQDENQPNINSGDSDVEYIEIIVSKGDDSSIVSRKLYNSGIVDSAAEYDAFLAQHGYDKRITTGTKTIYITDTWQEIAEKLTQ